MEEWAGVGMIVIGLLFAIVLSRSIIASIRAAAKRNSEFIERSTIVSQDMPPGVQVLGRFQPQPRMAHAVWLDLAIAGPHPIGFDLWLKVTVGSATLIEGSFPVTFDSDMDARGLPNAEGISALNTSSSSGFTASSTQSILRAFRFDAPPMPAWGEVHARIIPHPGTTFTRARLLLTRGDSPT
jgi:hypothetical protein